MSSPPTLVLGPMLRHAGETDATVWVETSARCTVGVLGHEAPTFEVCGHHYALVEIDGLAPGSATTYDVRLDGHLVWPPEGYDYPTPRIRTVAGSRPFRLVWGSCRTALPHHPPYTWSPTRDERGREQDALWALAEGMRHEDPETWPDALFFAGDQVYADDTVSPQTLEFARRRRDTARPPGRQVYDFPEYCVLYRESWSYPTIRWLLSTVPSTMIFDDHDVHDDWNTSGAWRAQMRRTDWWQEHIESALMSYWIYQHIGNLPRHELADDEVFRAVRDCASDAGDLLRDFAARAEVEDDGRKHARWSYARDFGAVRLVVVDSRAGRVVEGDVREMIDEEEWRWLEEQLAGEVEHLLVATSLPVLLPIGLHHVEAWNEAVCAGAWGRRAAGLGEKVRQALDLEHWAAFESSFRRLAGLLQRVTTGADGPVPRSVTLLSGDVHFSYVADASFRDGPAARCPIHQIVCSPIRNALPRYVRHGERFARSRVGRWFGRTLSRAAGVPTPPLQWEMTSGPWFDNMISTVQADGAALSVAFDMAPPGQGVPELHRVLDRRLA
jgi:hypothetical protein